MDNHVISRGQTEDSTDMDCVYTSNVLKLNAPIDRYVISKILAWNVVLWFKCVIGIRIQVFWIFQKNQSDDNSNPRPQRAVSSLL